MADLPRYFSQTAAGTYRQCPLRWKYRYIDKLPDPPGEPALVGSFAHRVLELLCDEPADARTTDRARQLAKEVWDPEIFTAVFLAVWAGNCPVFIGSRTCVSIGYLKRIFVGCCRDCAAVANP
jgi:hypothetical protein